jgi:hypothetical protein
MSQINRSHSTGSGHARNAADAQKHETESQTNHNKNQSQVTPSVLPAVIPPTVEEVISDKATQASNSQKDKPSPSRDSRLIPERLFTIVLVLCAMVGAAVAIYTSQQNKSLKAINETLAESAKIQADASKVQAEAAKAALDDARASGKQASDQQARLIAVNEELVKAASAQAKSGEQSAQAVERSAQTAERVSRPFIDIGLVKLVTLAPDAPVAIEITFLEADNPR